MDEMRKQVLADIGQLRKAAELILPKPVLIALGQVFTAAGKVAHAMHKTFTQSVVPKLNTYVLNEGIRDCSPLPLLFKADFHGSFCIQITIIINSCDSLCWAQVLLVANWLRTRKKLALEVSSTCLPFG